MIQLFSLVINGCVLPLLSFGLCFHLVRARHMKGWDHMREFSIAEAVMNLYKIISTTEIKVVLFLMCGILLMKVLIINCCVSLTLEVVEIHLVFKYYFKLMCKWIQIIFLSYILTRCLSSSFLPSFIKH